MKIRKYMVLMTAMAISALTFGSCAKADEETLHTNSSILSIEIQPAGGGTGIKGHIDETTGEIYFPISKKLREKYDITNLVVQANIQYDAKITPSLRGLKDLSDPMQITVTSGDKGSRTYSLWAFYIRRSNE